MFFSIVIILHWTHTSQLQLSSSATHTTNNTHTQTAWYGGEAWLQIPCRCIHLPCSGTTPTPDHAPPHYPYLVEYFAKHTVRVVLFHFIPWHTLQCKHIYVPSLLCWSTSIKLCWDQTSSWKLVNGIIESAEIWSNRGRLSHVQIVYQCHSKQPTSLVNQVGTTCCSWRRLLFTKAESCPNLVPSSSLDLHLNQHMDATFTCTLVMVELTPTQNQIWHETHYSWRYTCKGRIHW